MKRRSIQWFKLAALVLLLVLSGGTASAAPMTITVGPTGCDYTSIQAAITAAPEGSTIQVKEGTYPESLAITRSLSLMGEGPERTILERGITILAAKVVSVMGFTVKGQGIQVQDSQTISLANIAIVEGTTDGLSIVNSATVTLRGSVIKGNSATGVVITLGSKAIISANTITGNGGDGISIRASQADVADNTIQGNGGCGIRADAASTITESATIAQVSGNQAGNLCDRATALDCEPPIAPQNLQVSPEGWTNQDPSLDWQNPEDLTEIVAAWYEFGQPPTAPGDGTQFQGKPIILQNPPEGEVDVYVWLEDARGNKSYLNRTEGTLHVDRTAPTGSLTINDGAQMTDSLLVTLDIQAEDRADDQPGSGIAEMRFSNDGRIWSDWEPFKETRSNWDLSAYGGSKAVGAKTVWVQLKDEAENTCDSFTTEIILHPQKGMVLIPEGSFEMGDSFNEGDSDERPVHTVTVTVSSFYMDRYEVTKALWDEVENWASANGYDIGPGSVASKAVDHPVQNVTWYEAVKWANARSEKEGLTPCYTVSGNVYRTGQSTPDCNWSANGYRLPTEAEWEYAARGGVAGHRFPWSDTDTIQHSRANYESSSSYSYDTSPTRGYHPDYDTGGYPYTSPVGSFAANGYDLYDMAGNVWEWCWDWYSSGYYSSSPGTDPRGPASGSYRVTRGGSWDCYAIYCRVANRSNNSPDSGSNYLGFRLVRTAP